MKGWGGGGVVVLVGEAGDMMSFKEGREYWRDVLKNAWMWI